MKTRKIISLTLAVFICLALSVGLGAYERQFQIQINGTNLSADVRATVSDGFLYVPLRAVCDALGSSGTDWNQSTRTATVYIRNIKITVTEGSSIIEANGRYFYNNACAKNIGGILHVPMATISRIFTCEYYAADNGILYIGDNGGVCRPGSEVYRSDEVLWLARIIKAEALGEPMRGKIAVGNTVLNRVRSSDFPNTIYGVIFDKKYGVQFTPVANGTIYNTPDVNSVTAAKICLEGYSLSDEILYFVNPRLSPYSWASKNRPYAFMIGAHAFYK